MIDTAENRAEAVRLYRHYRRRLEREPRRADRQRILQAMQSLHVIWNIKRIAE